MQVLVLLAALVAAAAAAPQGVLVQPNNYPFAASRALPEYSPFAQQYSAPVYSGFAQQYSAPVYSGFAKQYSAPVYSGFAKQYSAPVYSGFAKQYSAPVYSGFAKQYSAVAPQYSSPVYSAVAPQYPYSGATLPAAYAKQFPAQSGLGVARILKFENEADPAGSYRFSYETENGISAAEQGAQIGKGEEGGAIKEGFFSYTGDNGVVYTVNYRADENGFQAAGEHLPTPPPIPAEIQRSLELNAATNEKYDDQGRQL